MELLILVFFLVILLYTSELFLIMTSLLVVFMVYVVLAQNKRDSPVAVEVPRGPLCLNSRSYLGRTGQRFHILY